MSRSDVHFEIFDGVLMAVLGEHSPTTESHAAFISFLKERNEDYDVMLLFSPGGTPDMVQRKEFVGELKNHNQPIAVLTDNKFARGAMTAVSWFVDTPLKLFSPQTIEDAISFLGSDKDMFSIRSRMETLISQGTKIQSN